MERGGRKKDPTDLYVHHIHFFMCDKKEKNVNHLFLESRWHAHAHAHARCFHQAAPTPGGDFPPDDDPHLKDVSGFQHGQSVSKYCSVFEELFWGLAKLAAGC